MISLEYVNGSFTRETDDLCRPFELFLETSKREIDEMFAEFSIVEEKVLLESSIMGTVPESTMMVYEEGKKNIFTTIGEAIIKLYNKFVEFIDKCIDKIKSLSFEKKSDLQKLEVLIKKHPDLKNEVIAAFNEGALDLQDAKSLKELDASFEEILKMAKKKDVDPNTLRGKWEKAKEKFEKDEKSWKVVKVASAAKTVITAAIAVKTIPAVLAKYKNDYAKDREEAKEREAKIINMLDDEGAIGSDTGIFRLLLDMSRELFGKHTATRKDELSVIEKCFNGITSLLDKLPGSKKAAERKVIDARTTKDRTDSENAAERRTRLDDAYDTAYHQQAGREAYNKQHPKSKT